MPKLDTHSQTSELLDCAPTNSFIPVITKPTRITFSTATLIDNIYIKYNITDMEIESGILTTDLSDHLPCICTLKFEKAAHKTKKELTFQHRNIDENAINRMKILLSQIDWSHLHTFTVENAYQNFFEKINRIINTVAPLKKSNYKT